jgi:hypothetical protein
MSHDADLTSQPEAVEMGNEAAEDTGAYLRSLSERFRAHIPEEERRRIPPDFAKNHRHYRNAFRKEAESGPTSE